MPHLKTILGLHSISRDSNDKRYGSHVGVHMQQKNAITTPLSLYTNMAAMTSHANREYMRNSAKQLNVAGYPFIC